ncbi:MAG: hypothetical protein ACN6O6_20290 [Pseudomonas sp.]|uniref:hypothetical protein n=1 Tax=Pseudomonas sp. TaxID=306 RepID=UPI003D0E5E81
MKKALIILLIALCSACAKDHGKPIASLDYTSITARPGTGLYDIRFSANVDVLSLFPVDERPIGSRLRCALTDDHDFSVEHVLQKSARGPVEYDEPPRRAAGFAFVATVFFTETINNGRSDRTLEGAELQALLANTQATPCRFIAIAHGVKPYYSAILLVPNQDIRREIERQD